MDEPVQKRLDAFFDPAYKAYKLLSAPPLPQSGLCIKRGGEHVGLEQGGTKKFIGEFEHTKIRAGAVEMKVKSKNQLDKAAPTLDLGSNKKSKNKVKSDLKIELRYIDKEPEKAIINTPAASLQTVKTFGKTTNGWTNMLIFGENLAALKTLMDNPDFRGQVKLVYIDPPFSTNHEFRGSPSRTSTISSSAEDQIAYEDKLLGAEYLEFLRKRLIFLRELLAHDGSIYVHIDWKAGHYVKVLMDEVFGEKHFVNDVARIKCNPKNFPRPAYGNVKDMILVYSKTDKYVWNESTADYTEEEIQRLFPKIDKDGNRYTTNPLHAPGETKNGPTGQPWKGIKPPKGRHWRYHPDELTRLDELGLIEWSSTGNPRKKIYADEFIEKKKKRQDIWEFKDPAYPSYPTEKNLEMLKVIIEASSNKEDLVLDCFAGSGTTLLASEKLGRRWIGIDNSEMAIKTTIKKLSKVENCKLYTLYDTPEKPINQDFR